MDILRAKEIVEILADGVNPMTGEILSEGDSCNQAEVVRAFYTVLKYLNSSLERTSQEPNAGKPWTLADEQILCQMFDSGCSKKAICERLQRSQGAIAARLVKLGKIRDRAEYRER